MRHGITEQDWLEYLDGRAAPEERLRLEGHLRACLDCQNFVERLEAVDATMRSAALELQSRLTVTPDEITAARERTVAIASDRCVSVRIGILYLLLVPLCGEEMSGRAIRRAARCAVAASAHSTNGQLWNRFLDHLHEIIAPLCGEPVAGLIRTRGMNLERGAA
jgi:anti-sigma factor RsiW